MSNQGSANPRHSLSRLQAVAIIVGIVIGAGIFKAPSLVAGNVPSEFWLIAVWTAGGVISLIGALCYAELAMAYPHAGGDYHFLTVAYGKGLALLYAWARFAVITTGSITLLAFVFGDYMSQIIPLGPYSSAVWAALSIIGLTWLNMAGLHGSATTQSWLTSIEVLGLVLIVVAAFWLAGGGGTLPRRRSPWLPRALPPSAWAGSAWRWFLYCSPMAAGTRRPTSAPNSRNGSAWCVSWCSRCC